MRRTRAGSQEAACAVGLGSASEGSATVQNRPRTPMGPSERVIERRPISGISMTRHMSRPESRAVLVSRSSFASAVSTASW